MAIYSTTTVKIIAEQLRWAKEKEFSTAILVGAGMSVTAGIPAAKGIIDEIKNQFKELAQTAEKETYPAYMSLLGHLQRKKLIGEFVDKAKVNMAHLYLATLVKEGYVDRILTTNFDPLIIKSLALHNVFPAVYDFAASQVFMPGESADLSVYYLHGQRDGFVLLNTDEEVTEHAKKLTDVFSDSRRGRCWLVIGYSGDNDPVFDQLAKEAVYSNKLFWIGYDEQPSQHVEKRILTPRNKCAYFLGKQDADLFFLALARELNLLEPQIISHPFTHIKESLLSIADLTKDAKVTNLTTETKKWIDMAVRIFENGEDYTLVAGKKEEITNDELIRRAREIWTLEKYDEIDSVLKDLSSKDVPEVKTFIAYAFNNLGVDLHRLGKFEDAIEKYEQSLKLKPDYHEAYYNWGTALSDWAKQKTGEESDRLYTKACEKYEQSLKIKPDKHGALYNLACLYSLFKQKKESLINLQKAISLNAVNKEDAKSDKDFEWLWEDEEFKKIVSEL
ncbi:MAG: tetratricopeptide repeat protein [Bacteroidetes bacterium]|nr:MAG: tetratricopeptide repeat protein [Bacteroidota bacterium]